MNIKNRIKKLETSTDAAGNCQCKNTQRSESWWQDLSIDAEDNEPKLNGDPVPDFCPLCRKPIEKQVIILQLVDETTKEPFPEEWNAYNQTK